MKQFLAIALAFALSAGTAGAQTAGGTAPRGEPPSGTSQVGPNAGGGPSPGTNGSGSSQAQIPSGRSDDDINSKTRNGAGPGATTPVR